MKPNALTSLFWKEDKHFVGWCLELDVSSFGNSEHEARVNLQEAVDLTLEDTDMSLCPTIESANVESLPLVS